jgi:phosphoserine phosphatase RsbU/P
LESEKILQLKEMELNSLLEVTMAINNNLPEDHLYRIFNFIVRGNLQLNKIALFVLEGEEWECKVSYGTEEDIQVCNINQSMLQVREVTDLKDLPEDPALADFDYLVPVYHKNKILAQVIVGCNKDEFTDLSFIQALTNILIVAIENKRLGRRQLQQEAMRKEMEIAKNVQALLFPTKLPYNDKLQVVADYFPHHSVGGDYYDFIKISQNKWLMCIGDVSGKGVPAALLMSNFQASLRTLIRHTSNLKYIVQELNYQISQSSKGENYITVFLAIYDESDHSLNYINAGHNPPVLITEGIVQLLESGTTILGSFDPLPFLEENRIHNLENFTVFSYTDGLTEVFNEQDEEFGSEKLLEFIKKNYELELKEIHLSLIKNLHTFKGRNDFKDDITFLSCRFR